MFSSSLTAFVLMGNDLFLFFLSLICTRKLQDPFQILLSFEYTTKNQRFSHPILIQLDYCINVCVL